MLVFCFCTSAANDTLQRGNSDLEHGDQEKVECRRLWSIQVQEDRGGDSPRGLEPNIAVPHILHSDLVALAGCWPLPAGSRRGLARIMPGMKSRTRQQQGLKALSLALGSGGKGKSVPVSTISAMLCFWNEHNNGVLRWVPQWWSGTGSH